MIIKRLTLYNFGVYASYNTFAFNNSEKTVTLIGGMNGRGKTTFLEAILLALYGSNSVAFLESKYNSYGSYLRAHVNVDDGTNNSFVELEFNMNEKNDKNNYIINRSWNINGKYVKDVVNVKKNEIEDDFLTQNWTMFIESVLPSGLSNFFFFDGEKIAEIAEDETSLQMKEAIKSLLGINIIDTLQKDLTRISKRLLNEQIDDYSDMQIETLRISKEEQKKCLDRIDKDILNVEIEIEKINFDIEAKQHQFDKKGGEIANLSKSLYLERGNLNAQSEQIQSNLLDFAASELPLAMVQPLIGKIIEQSNKEYENNTMHMVSDKISEIFDKYPDVNNENELDIAKFIEFIKIQAANSNVDNIFNLSHSSYIHSMDLYNSQIEKRRKQYLSDKGIQKKIEKRISEIDNYLSVDIDEKVVQDIYKEIDKLKNLKVELQTQLNIKNKERVSINGKLLKATTEFNRYVEQSLKNMEREDDVKRLKGYVYIAQSLSERYKIELQKAKVDKLAATMTECYKKLIGKKNLIDKIEMDSETLDYYYVDENNKKISRNILSAGEKQLIVVSMLWALGICSGKKLPVIIDTPLARLDAFHRTALIDKYFPYASDQTVILSTDSEIDKTYYGIIKKYVGNEFTLVYNEDMKCSTIEDGYFKGVIG